MFTTWRLDCSPPRYHLHRARFLGIKSRLTIGVGGLVISCNVSINNFLHCGISKVLLEVISATENIITIIKSDSDNK
jgi:hypothetical protein